MKVSKVKCVSIVLVSSLVLMQQAFALDLDSVSGLKRFNQNAQLQVNSSFDVRGVKLGENVKAVTASLLEQGGELHYISGGIRSRRLK